MSRKYNPYRLPRWLRKIRFYCKQIVLPICFFQLIRIIFVPTTGDIILLTCLLLLYVLLANDWI